MLKEDHFQLQKGEIYTQSKKDVGITCLTGHLWITQSKDGRDIILSPGEFYWADRSKGKFVVEALQDSSLQLSPPLVLDGGQISAHNECEYIP